MRKKKGDFKSPVVFMTPTIIKVNTTDSTSLDLRESVNIRLLIYNSMKSPAAISRSYCDRLVLLITNARNIVSIRITE